MWISPKKVWIYQDPPPLYKRGVRVATRVIGGIRGGVRGGVRYGVRGDVADCCRMGYNM
jgi:hypothetical protein